MAVTRARERALAEDPGTDLLTPDHLTASDLGCATLDVPKPRVSGDDEVPLCASFQIENDELGDSFRRLQAERAALDDVERRILEAALSKHHGVVAHAAGELGLGRTSVLSRLETLGIERGRRKR